MLGLYLVCTLLWLGWFESPCNLRCALNYVLGAFFPCTNLQALSRFTVPPIYKFIVYLMCVCEYYLQTRACLDRRAIKACDT